MRKLLLLTLFLCSSCTYSIIMTHTQGSASDVVDDTDTISPVTEAKAELPKI